MREHLKTFLGRENIWKEHIEVFTTDIKPWFRDHKIYRLDNANRSVNSLFLFRMPITPRLSIGSMPTEKRIGEINKVNGAPKTGRFSKFDDAREIPTQADMVLYLEGLASGLKIPKLMDKQK